MAGMSQLPCRRIKQSAKNFCIKSEGWHRLAEFLESAPHDELK
jgi:hypothetical protein